MILQHVTHNIICMAYPKEWVLDGPALISVVDSKKHSRHITGVTHNISCMAYLKEWFLDGPALIYVVDSKKHSRHITG